MEDHYHRRLDGVADQLAEVGIGEGAYCDCPSAEAADAKARICSKFGVPLPEWTPCTAEVCRPRPAHLPPEPGWKNRLMAKLFPGKDPPQPPENIADPTGDGGKPIPVDLGTIEQRELVDVMAEREHIDPLQLAITQRLLGKSYQTATEPIPTKDHLAASGKVE